MAPRKFRQRVALIAEVHLQQAPERAYKNRQRMDLGLRDPARGDVLKERGRAMPAMIERGHETEEQKEKQRQGSRGFMRLAQCPAAFIRHFS